MMTTVWLGLMAGCLLVLLIYTLWMVPPQFGKTLSMHIEQRTRTVIAGKILLPLTGLSLALWTVQSASPLAVQLLLLVVSLNFCVMGLVPFGVSQQRTLIHNIAAWGCIPVITIIETLILLSDAHSVVRVVTSGAMVCQAIVLGCCFFAKPWHRYIMLVGQAVYFSLFVAVVWAMECAHA